MDGCMDGYNIHFPVTYFFIKLLLFTTDTIDNISQLKNMSLENENKKFHLYVKLYHQDLIFFAPEAKEWLIFSW